jgi:RES domain-containing protein
MRLWRISNFADLAGDGGLFASGRWHSRGRRIVYLSDHPASALLEVLVHLEVDPEDLPSGYQLLAVDVDDSIAVDVVEPNELTADWTDNQIATRALGDRWLAAGRSALLRVPSAIVPFAWTWLLNPGHVDVVKTTVADVVNAPFDPRLFR